MGRWSQYRLRGTSHVPPPPVEVLIAGQVLGAAGPSRQLTSGSSIAGTGHGTPIVAPAGGLILTRLVAVMRRAGSPLSDFIPRAWQASGGSPTGTVLGSGATIPESSITGSFATIDAPFGFGIAGGVSFFVGWQESTLFGGNAQWQTTDIGVAGIPLFTTVNGSTWSANPSATDRVVFELWGYVL